MSDIIVSALNSAADRLDQPTVHEAYQQLAHVLGVVLTGQPFDAQLPLTPTQLVLIRHALQRLSPAQMTVINSAAEELQGRVGVNVTGNTVITNSIGTVTGGSVMMIGISNGEPPYMPAAPTPAPAPAKAQAAPPSISVSQVHDVFISYSRKDAPSAKRLYADLRAAGLIVWMDNDELQPGNPSWQKAIEKAIRSSGCVVALLTPSAKASEWVEREIHLAQTHHIPIVPLLYSGDETNALPLSLFNIQWTPMRTPREHRANLQKVVAAIRELNA